MKVIRILFWAAAVLLGGAQTWYIRHRVFSDGVSYMTIAQQYANGDWHAALNAYWSPLYSWLLAIYLAVFRPSQYWEASSMHIVNFAAFLLSCFFFEKLFAELIGQRPRDGQGFSPVTLWMVGYLAVLQGGLWLIGIGYNSPDMVAYGLTAAAGWLTLRVARGERGMREFVGLGVVLGLGYLDRTAFAPLCAVYLGVMWFLIRQVRPLLVSAAIVVAIGAPFAVAISLKKGAPTIGESGKLNYGWEVDGAVRSTHWQGEPGDIGQPEHPTRLLIKEPVPVYEFGSPVAGVYPPWYDPSYWYQGIKPGLKPARQIKALLTNLETTVYHVAFSGAFLILVLVIAFTRGRAIQPGRWPWAYWAVLIPALAGLGLYCLVFVDRRYIAGFLVLLWITPLAAAVLKPGLWARRLDLAAQLICLGFALFLVVKLRADIVVTASDLIHRHEGEGNVQWMLARKLEQLGVKPGDKIAYIGFSIDADWVRLVGAKIVAETPVTYSRGLGLTNFLEVNESYVKTFFNLDPESREKVYAAYRQAGAVIVVANRIPEDGIALDWTRLLDPHDPKYPHTEAQIHQAASYYRRLVPAPNGEAY